MRTILVAIVLTKYKKSKIQSKASENPSDKPKETLAVKTPLNFHDFHSFKEISTGIFPVYLVQGKSINKQVVMKMFPFVDGQPNPLFINETNSSKLSHSNVISTLFYQEYEMVEMAGQLCKLSYVVMEYAPYGNMLVLVKTSRIKWDDKLVRTYFNQLIQAIEYMHEQNIAHLDLNVGNLLIGENFEIKIADFDLSQNMKNKTVVNTKGTKDCRAPEIIDGSCQDPKASDIYSAGIILFMMKSRGTFPFLEDSTEEENLYEILCTDPKLFWKKHSKLHHKTSYFLDEDFQSLFILMTARNTRERATIKEIKSSTWFQGPIYTNTELKTLLGLSK